MPIAFWADNCQNVTPDQWELRVAKKGLQLIFLTQCNGHTRTQAENYFRRRGRDCQLKLLIQIISPEQEGQNFYSTCCFYFIYFVSNKDDDYCFKLNIYPLTKPLDVQHFQDGNSPNDYLFPGWGSTSGLKGCGPAYTSLPSTSQIFMESPRPGMCPLQEQQWGAIVDWQSCSYACTWTSTIVLIGGVIQSVWNLIEIIHLLQSLHRIFATFQVLAI